MIKKIIRYFLVVMFLAMVAGTFVFLYSKAKKKPVVYKTINPEISSLVKKTVTTGSVLPRKEVEMKPTVSGIIEELYIEAGDKVKKGDRVAKIRIIPDMFRLNEAESRCNIAKLKFDDIKVIYTRQKAMYEKGVIAEVEFLKSRVEYQTALEEYEAAENNLQLTREGVSRKSSASTNTLIRSTIQGTVLDVPVEVGHSVIEANAFNSGTTIASVADMGEIVFVGNIDETEVGKIKPGMPLLLTIGAIEEVKYNALLEHIAPKGVEENGVVRFRIKAAVTPGEGPIIRAGYSASAEIVLDKRDSIMVIPESVLKFEKNADSIYVEVEAKETQQYEKRYIKTGLSDGIKIEVTSGLTLGEKVKTEEVVEEKKKGK